MDTSEFLVIFSFKGLYFCKKNNFPALRKFVPLYGSFLFCFLTRSWGNECFHEILVDKYQKSWVKLANFQILQNFKNPISNCGL